MADSTPSAAGPQNTPTQDHSTTPPSDGSSKPPPAPAPRRKRRRWLRVTLGLLTVLLLLVAFAPALAGTSVGRQFVMRLASRYVNGRVDAADLSVGWSRGIEIKGLELRNPQGEVVLKASRISTQLPLLKTLMSGFSTINLGRTEIENVELAHVKMDQKGEVDRSTILKSSKNSGSSRSPRLSGDIYVKHLTGWIGEPSQADALQIYPSDVHLVIDDLNKPIKSDLQLNVGPAHGTGQRPGSLTVTGEMDVFEANAFQIQMVKQKLALQAFPLRSLAPVLAMAGIDLTLEGTAEGSLDATMTGPAQLSATGDINISGFRASGAALHGDTVSTNLHIPISFATSGEDHVKGQVKLETEFGQAVLDVNVSGDAVENLLSKQPPEQEGSVSLAVDLTNAAGLINQMPRTLRLLKDVKIESARARGQLAAYLSKDKVLVKTDFKSEQITAIRTPTASADRATSQSQQAKNLTLAPVEQAIEFTYVPSPSPRRPGEIDGLMVKLRSNFAELSGQSSDSPSGKDFNLVGKGDLSKLSEQLAGIVDLGTMKMAGQWTLKAATHRDEDGPSGISKIEAGIELVNATLSGIGKLAPIKESWLNLGLTATLFSKDSIPRALSDATVTLKNDNPEKPAVQLVLTGKADLQTLTSEQFEVQSLVVDVPRVQKQYGQVLPALQWLTEGSIRISGGGAFDSKALVWSDKKPLKLEGAGLTVKNPAEKEPALRNQPLLATLAGRVDLSGPQLGARVARLTMSSGDLLDLHSSGGELLLAYSPKTGALQGGGGLTVRADLKKLSDLATGTGSAAQKPAKPAAAGAGELTKAMLAGDLKLASGGKSFKVSGDVKLDLTVTASKKNISEIVALTFHSEMPEDSAQPIAADLDLKMQNTGALAVQLASAKLADLKNQRRIVEPIQAKVHVDWPRLWEMVGPVLSADAQEELKDLKIEGVMDQTLTVAGSFPATGPDRQGKIVPLPVQNSLKFLTATGGLRIARLSTQGMDLRDVDLPVSLRKGVLSIDEKAGTIHCNNGAVELAGVQVDFTYQDPRMPEVIHPRLTIPQQNRRVVSKVRMNPVLAQTALGKYVNTAFSGSRKADGELSVTSVYCNQLPLSEAIKNPKASGRAKFELSMTEVELDSKGLGIITQGLALFATGALKGGFPSFENIRGSIKDSSVAVEEGKVLHKLNLVTDKMGTWHFDGNLKIATRSYDWLNVTIPTAVFGSRELTRYAGESLTVPFKGLISQPSVAPDFIAKFARENLLKGAVPGLIEDAVGGKKDKRSSREKHDSGTMLQDLAGSLLNKESKPDAAMPKGAQPAGEQRDIGDQAISASSREQPATQPATQRSPRRRGK